MKFQLGFELLYNLSASYIRICVYSYDKIREIFRWLHLHSQTRVLNITGSSIACC
jgi:hypothetical protein